MSGSWIHNAQGRREALRGVSPTHLLVVGSIAVYVAANEVAQRLASGPNVITSTVLPALIVVLAGLSCVRRSQLESTAARGWQFLAAALSMRAIGGVAGSVQLLGSATLPVPTAELFTLAFYPLAALALAQFIALNLGDTNRYGTEWLDIVICGLGALALIAFLALDPASADRRTMQDNLAFSLVYPICDVFLIVLVVAGLRSWLRTRRGLFLIAAVGLISFGDTIRLFTLVGHSEAGRSIAGYLWLAGAAALGLMAAESFRRPKSTPAATGSLSIAFTFALLSASLIIVDRFRSVHPIAFTLSGLTVLAAVGRSIVAFKELRTLTQTRREARTDELTQLPNRRSFSEMIARSVDEAAFEGGPLAVLMVDLDGFKVINDTLGHHTGDELLREVARRFSGTLAPGDMLARLGGDEFGIVVHPQEDTGWALAAGTRLVQSLEARMELDGVPIQVRASVGAALYPSHGDSPSLLLQRADVAMYEAKRSGGGVRFYSQTFDRNSRERLEHLEDLRMAVDHNQLMLYFQPKVRFVDGVLIGVEALVRWNHPTRGLLSPDEFLPVAIEGGLLPQLTRKVLELAVRQAGEWHASGGSLGVAVNVGSADLVDERFPSFVEDVLRRNALPAGLLTIEITEDAVIKDPVRTAEVVARLRKMGAKVSIDDFGAGYASLSLLRELDLDELKLDKSLVDRVDSSNRQKALVRAAVGLAHALGLRLVAEGVETVEVWRHLQLLDCDVAQGYLVSRPLPPEQLQVWLEAQQRRRRPPSPPPAPTYLPSIRRRQRTLPAQAWAGGTSGNAPAPSDPPVGGTPSASVKSA